MNKTLISLSCVTAATLTLQSCAPIELSPQRVVVPSAALGGLRALPPGHRTVYIGGIKYYTHGGKYYRYNNGRYSTIAKPRAIITPHGVKVLPNNYKPNSGTSPIPFVVRWMLMILETTY